MKFIAFVLWSGLAFWFNYLSLNWRGYVTPDLSALDVIIGGIINIILMTSVSYLTLGGDSDDEKI